jgi:predicted O-methyltransferase YrrM
MPANSELITIDINEELEDFAAGYFARFRESGNNNISITQKVGDAIQLVPELEGTFDLIFIDADKPNYVNYFHLIMDKVHAGSLIISDNVLWHGKVVEDLNEKDKSTPVLLEYNKLLKEDARLQTVLLSVRDGLTLSRVL